MARIRWARSYAQKRPGRLEPGATAPTIEGVNPPGSIQTGDSVVLHEAGTLLSVRAVSGEYAYCEWRERGVERQGTFHLSQLEPFIPRPPAAADAVSPNAEP